MNFGAAKDALCMVKLLMTLLEEIEEVKKIKNNAETDMTLNM